MKKSSNSSSSTSLPSSSTPTKITLDSQVPTPTQPHSNPITNLASSPNSVPTGSLLALNDNYIVYAVKNGLIRVMDRSSSLRTLLRGHPERITDVSFFGSSSDILASVSSKDCRIWRVFGREDELCSEILLEMLVVNNDRGDDSRRGVDPKRETAADMEHARDAAGSLGEEVNSVLERIVWHPFNPNQFILLQRGSSVAIFVETTKLLTTPSSHAQEEPSHAVCQIPQNSNADGMLHLIVTDARGEDCGINDLSWSNQDVRHVLTAHRDGCVRLWDLRTTIVIDHGPAAAAASSSGVSAASSHPNIVASKKRVSAQCLMTVQVSKHGAPVQRCFFLSAFQDASAMFRTGGYTAMEPGSYMTSPFLTYTSEGEVALWSPFTSSGSPPKIVRIFQLSNRNNSMISSNVSVCTLPFSPPSSMIPTVNHQDLLPPSTFVVLSDYQGAIHALHLASQWRDVPVSVTSTGNATHQRIAAVTGFDYVVSFQSLQAIYSQSVVTSLDESSDVKQWNLDMYCVQNKAVQKLTLSPAMCAAPFPLEPGVYAAGIAVEEIRDCKASVRMDSIEIEEGDDGDEDETVENMEFHDYEDLEEASMEDEDVDHVGEEDNDDDKDANLENPKSHPLMTSSFANDQDSGAFSNWLGNLAGVVNSDIPTPKSPMVTSKSEIDLSSLPLPDEPEVDNRASSAPPKRATPDLLSPMQILGLPVKKEEELDIPKTKKNVSSKSQEKKIKSVAAPSDGKKVTILKREDKSMTKEAVEPPMEGNAVHPISASSGAITRDEIEQIVRKAVSAHFHKQETIITAEIQKAVRYEVQSGLVPILNKTVSQTLEQTVTKTMKSSVTKTVKEGMKMNTSELASSISSQIQDPLVKSMHQTMREVMVPAYEKGTRQMFEQISTSIETGLELKQKENEETAKIMDGMVKRMDAMGKTIEVLIKAVAQLQTGSIPQQSQKRQSEPFPADRSEMSRKKISELLRANQYEKAFTQALSASDSAMALFVCKQSDLSTILEGDAPKLSQPILLCLMQQLGADLSTDEDLSVKLAWLQSMALVLDPQNESIAKHIKGVLQQLVTNLQTKMAQSDPALRRHLQMLLQVIRGIGNA